MTIRVTKKKQQKRNVRVGSGWISRSRKAIIIRLADGTTLIIAKSQRKRSERSPDYVVYAPEEIVEVVEE